MKYSVFLFIVFLSFFCQKKEQKETKKKIEITKIKSLFDTIYKSENIIIYGDSTIDKNKINYSSIKFEPYISFNDFPVNKLPITKNVKLDLESLKEANEFRTRLQEAFKTDTINFAGHYTFVFWGCGSPCKISMVIDRLTGKIYESPTSSIGYEFKSDSKMLIVNPPNEKGFYDDCIYCKPIIYVFNEKNKIFEELKPKY
ncbi:hypothetical protein [Flavobacterium sp.]|uniref:hypothetical protein n=1 Tax=Flavobacterium sp. TaxID=239 RepID=UPI003753B462